MTYQGDFAVGATVQIPWSTNDGNGAAITRATDGSIRIYKNNSTTQRASSSGVTDSEDFAGVTGTHLVNIDTSDNADPGFYATGNNYHVMLVGATIDGQTVNRWLGSFSIGNRVNAQPSPRRNVAFADWQFVMTDAVTHAPQAGLTDASFTKQYNIDGAGWLTLSGTVTEIGQGVYVIDLTAAELDGANIILRFAAGGCDDTYEKIITAA